MARGRPASAASARWVTAAGPPRPISCSVASSSAWRRRSPLGRRTVVVVILVRSYRNLAILSRRLPAAALSRLPWMDPRPIGVFDSGVGGLTVLHECLVTLPHEDFLYFGDSDPERFPYGTKPPEMIRRVRPRDRQPPGRPRRQAAGGGVQLRHGRGAARAAARVRGAADRRDHARGARRGAGHPQPPGRRDGDAGNGRQRPLPGGGARARRRRRGHAGRLPRAGAADPGR